MLRASLVLCVQKIAKSSWHTSSSAIPTPQSMPSFYDSAAVESRGEMAYASSQVSSQAVSELKSVYNSRLTQLLELSSIQRWSSLRRVAAGSRPLLMWQGLMCCSGRGTPPRVECNSTLRSAKRKCTRMSIKYGCKRQRWQGSFDQEAEWKPHATVLRLVRATVTICATHKRAELTFQNMDSCSAMQRLQLMAQSQS